MISLRINDRLRSREVRFFNSYKIGLKFGAIASTFSFDFFYDPENKEQKELACIGHYHICSLMFGNELVMKGNMISTGFKSQDSRQMAAIGGYSLAGFLEDCSIPKECYPLEYSNLSIKQIADKLCQPFGIAVAVSDSVKAAMDAPVEKITMEPADKVKDVLSKLAAQKNIILTHTPNGNILFTKAAPNAPAIAHFEPGQPGATTYEMVFNGQAMHSHIIAMKQAASGGGNAGESAPLRNPYVIGSVYRPLTVVQGSGDDIDTEQFAKNTLAAELRNISWKITTDRWLIDKKIVRPGSIITCYNPEIYLFKKTRLFIDSVELSGDQTSATAVLNCYLPEVYNGETPVYIAQGINLH